MGSCVSSHTRKSPVPVSTIPDIPSPVKEPAVNGGGVLKSQWSVPRSTSGFRDNDHAGSKDEAFFDSRAWLDSDCEDDFFSVNGDFTPSRGNTPVHNSFTGTPRVIKIPSITTDKPPSSVPGPTPVTKKKKLAELFRDSIGRSEEIPGAANVDNSDASPEKKTSDTPKLPTTTILDVLPSSEQGTPYVSGANSLSNSQRTPNEPNQEEKLDKLVQQRCLPSLKACRISMDRKKKMSPAIAVND
ncbi:uncharacterized protein At3g27210 isoform X1 [Punica granatum]|nr:uncharacterized protein At3g27210 isoform X1 [Punica granatum]